MGNAVSTKIIPAFTRIRPKIEKRTGPIGTFWMVIYAFHTGMRWTELESVINRSKEEGEQIILLGKNDDAKEKVFKYFVDDLKNLGPGVIQKTKEYLGGYKLTVTSIEGSLEENDKKYLESLNRTTLLVFHPSKQKQFTSEWNDHFDYLKKNNKRSHIVLTDCSCSCEYYTNCRIPNDIPQECKEKQIILGTEGEELGYRLFFMKFPHNLMKELRNQIPTTGMLVAGNAPSILKFFLKAREVVVAFIRFRRNGSSFIIKHCYI